MYLVYSQNLCVTDYCSKTIHVLLVLFISYFELETDSEGNSVNKCPACMWTINMVHLRMHLINLVKRMFSIVKHCILLCYSCLCKSWQWSLQWWKAVLLTEILVLWAVLRIFRLLVNSAAFALVHLHPLTQGHGGLDLCQQLRRKILQHRRVYSTCAQRLAFNLHWN